MSRRLAVTVCRARARSGDAGRPWWRRRRALLPRPAPRCSPSARSTRSVRHPTRPCPTPPGPAPRRLRSFCPGSDLAKASPGPSAPRALCPTPPPPTRRRQMGSRPSTRASLGSSSPARAACRCTASSEITLSALGPGQGVSGFIGPVGSVSNPAVAYPPSTAGFTPLNEGFAGVILATPGRACNCTASTSCTPRTIGVGYNLGTWDASNVDNVGFVARLFNNYYPNNPAASPEGWPPTAGRRRPGGDLVLQRQLRARRRRAAAASRSVDREHGAEQGALPAPTPPSLPSPPRRSQVTRPRSFGPFTVVTDDPNGARVTATGASLFADAAGTTPIANAALVPSGKPDLADRRHGRRRHADSGGQCAGAPGNAYLYSGNIDGVTDAQRLILAQTVRVTTNASAWAEFATTTTGRAALRPRLHHHDFCSTSATPTTPTTSPSVAPSVLDDPPDRPRPDAGGLRRRTAARHRRLLRLRHRALTRNTA